MTASGMGAITCSILAHVAAGDHVIAPEEPLHGRRQVRDHILPRFGVEHRTVDQTDPDAFAAAIRPETKVIFIETPRTRPARLPICRAIADLAKQHGITTICDNTFASPVNQQPVNAGIDFVVHSATKYLGGHHDLIAGAIWDRPSASRGLVVHEYVRSDAGTNRCLAPVRGLRTLPLRVRHHNESAGGRRALEGTRGSRRSITRVLPATRIMLSRADR